MKATKSVKKQPGKTTGEAVKDTTKKTKKANPGIWTTVYKGILQMKDHPIPTVFIEKLSNELLDWVENDPKANSIQQFTSQRRITRSLFENLCAHHSMLDEARIIAIEQLGAKRESMALDREWDVSMIKAVQHKYNKDWEDASHFKIPLDNKGTQGPKNDNLIHQIVLGNGDIIDVNGRRE